MLNNQQPVKLHISNGQTLKVHSIFKTIQGEGPFSGTPCVFIRLAGCNLQCPNCDTEYTSDDLFYTYQIVAAIGVHAEKGLVVITGGEPFRQNIIPLIDTLLAHGYYVQVETNGTISPFASYEGQRRLIFSHNTSERSGAYIVCSPKTANINPEIEQQACGFKYVVNAEHICPEDGLPTKVLGLKVDARWKAARPSENFTGQIYIQPEDAGGVGFTASQARYQNLQAAIKSSLTHGYILNLQVHKIIGVQ